ncbi:hypothetical protein AMJ86_06040 [bacterium SM23_57]|nr:MAG: hypothetical protein AMJ86_06040 [bacterium SM23_57]
MLRPIRLFASLLLLLSPFFSHAQNLLNQPESVTYHAADNRYLVSNWATGHLVAIDSAGGQSYVLMNQSCFAGLHIIGDVVYVSCRYEGVRGFDLTTGLNVLNVPIPGAANINDITADNVGNLYVSYPSESKIYKINVAAANVSEFMTTGLYAPNGLCFDELYNRILICSYRNNSPIQAINLDDSTLSTVTTTFLDGLDGITMDSDRNVYVSSWETNTVYRFDSTFTNPPLVFSTHPDDPADIFFDTINNILAVPLFFTSQVEFIPATTSIQESTVGITPMNVILYPNYPNPFNPTTRLTFEIPFADHISLVVYNITGQEVTSLANGWFVPGVYQLAFDGTQLPSGLYFARLKAGDFSQVQKILLLK